ncbi:LPS translocon maturation chaperone LptM [Sphaerotilaceae bacterium SBD11-9]
MEKPDFSVAGRLIRLCAVGSLLAASLLAGCGQKGALVPPPAPAAAPSPAASAPR